MPIEFETLKQIKDKVVDDLVQSVNSDEPDTTKHIDPTIKGNYMRGLAEATGGGHFANQEKLKNILKQLFPQTAEDENLDMWGGFFGIQRYEGKRASGSILIQGEVGTVIPEETEFARNNQNFLTSESKTIALNSVGVSSITRSGQVATVTTSGAHGLASAMALTGAGADQAEYNIETKITVTDTNKFTFPVSGAPASPATGSISFSGNWASLPIESENYTQEANAESGAIFNIFEAIPGANLQAFAGFNGIIGGENIEENDDYLDRILERTANMTAPFTVPGIKIFLRAFLSYVTRAWVYRADNEGADVAGHTTIYFATDKEVNPIPTSGRVNEVIDLIINGTDRVQEILPANMPESYLHVVAPATEVVDIELENLSPDTPEMREAIETSLNAFFRNDVQLGQTITLSRLNNVIFRTIDANGERPAYDLNEPSADIEPAARALPILGGISYV